LEIWHRVSIAGKDAGYWQSRGLEMRPILSALDAEGRPKSWIAEIHEDDPRWPELKPYVEGRLNFVNTFFTDEERLAAEWCILRGCGILRPNQPVAGYWSRDYYADKCPVCGSGWTQIAPFHLAKEPKPGRNALASFAGDELFVTEEVLTAFRSEGFNGFDTWPLLVGKDKHPALNVKQLLVGYVAGPALADELVEHEHYRWTDCVSCGRRWHLYYNRGMLPLHRSALRSHVDFQMTYEWFGSERAARREILVSQRVTRLILAKQWTGADLSPVNLFE
jgi:hypothetical protein